MERITEPSSPHMPHFLFFLPLVGLSPSLSFTSALLPLLLFQELFPAEVACRGCEADTVWLLLS